MDFKIYFNKKRQWVDVTLWEVHPSTFYRWKGGRWGYFLAAWDNPKDGKFGELHFVRSRLRMDTITHEVFHLLSEWMFANRDPLTPRNEERYAAWMDELTRKFIRETEKLGIKL